MRTAWFCIGFILGVLIVRIYDGIKYLIKREQLREHFENWLEKERSD